ncbi:LysR family transcriptional regulator [Lelliottia amnigena]|nr:LysR family transcriptional regulator [Lelliottia amnigena]
MKPLLDVLIILDALEKEGSFAAASAKLFKTPSALSYTVHKLESDLNIQLLDRTGHRARFTRTGQMLLEKGREVLHTVRELEKQAVKLHQGWENELVIGVDDTFPFSLLTPLIEAFYQRHSVTRLKFINGVLGGSWEALTQGGRILSSARCMSRRSRANLVLRAWASLSKFSLWQRIIR